MQPYLNKMEKIAIIGLGYVGLPLAVEFGKSRDVVGFDINETRINELTNGKDSTLEVDSGELASAQKLQFTSDPDDMRDAQIFIVTVPTPIDEFKKPDLQPLLSASKTVGKYISRGDIVIYESTVYPGCTEEDCIPVIESESGLKFNEDFYAGYSPERINPGDKDHRLTNIVKVTSGSTPEIADKVDILYNSIITVGTHRASSIKVAEASKVIENSQRDLNIAFVNELALIFDRIGIDTTEVLEAAGSKWNFLPFRPGLVGGHCIGVDPYYLTYKAESTGYTPQVILSGRRINDNVGVYIAGKVVKLMTQAGNPIKNSKVLVLGVTFKENCPDIRNSKVIDVIRELADFGIDVEVYDPWANQEDVKDEYNIDLVNPNGPYHAVVLAVAHDEFKEMDYKALINGTGIIYDIKSVLPVESVTERL